MDETKKRWQVLRYKQIKIGNCVMAYYTVATDLAIYLPLENANWDLGM